MKRWGDISAFNERKTLCLRTLNTGKININFKLKKHVLQASSFILALNKSK